MDKFFATPFAATGDKTPVPTTVQPTGSVSYPEGFGPDYQADQATDPDAKDIPRDSMNQILFDLSNAIREYQVSGVPDFITSVQNGGTPYSYSVNAHVRYNDEIYESRINSNTDLPTVTASWRKISGAQSLNLIAEAAGTVNAMTAAFTPSLTAYQKGVPLFIRAFGANSSVTPTLNIDGLGAKTICKGANQTLASGDIPGAGYWMILQYDLALDKLVLANPFVPAQIGYGQTWQDVTASRATNTNYTNNTGRPICVSVYSGATVNAVDLYVDGVIVASVNNENNVFGALFTIVPVGSVYKTVGPITAWRELR